MTAPRLAWAKAGPKEWVAEFPFMPMYAVHVWKNDARDTWNWGISLRMGADPLPAYYGAARVYEAKRHAEDWVAAWMHNHGEAEGTIRPVRLYDYGTLRRFLPHTGGTVGLDMERTRPMPTQRFTFPMY